MPLTGTQGQASVHPSTITIAAVGGQSQAGRIRVLLHGVTHPCPDDLGVVLVHNYADAWRLPPP